MAIERQRGNLAGGVKKLVQLEGAAQQNGVVSIQVLLRQDRIGGGFSIGCRGSETRRRLAHVEIDEIIHLFRGIGVKRTTTPLQATASLFQKRHLRIETMG